MADVDPKLQSNRVKDLGGTVRPSRKIELAIIVAVSLILTVFALVCSHAGHPFQIFALMYLVSGQWSLTAGQWALAVAVLVVLAVACGVGACLGCTCQTEHGRKRVCKDGPVFDYREVRDAI